MAKSAITIINSDCRLELPQLRGRDFHCCITDPPYGDTALPWDQRCDNWIGPLSETLSPAASVWVFGSLRYIADLFSQFQHYGFRYSQDIVWEKQNGTGLHNDRFRRVHEHAVLFYRGRWRDVYHRPQFTPSARAKTVRRHQKPAHIRKIGDRHYTSIDGGPLHVRSVIKVRNEHGRAIHPTQKPVELLEHLIRYSCPPAGELVDLFAGSCSLAIAAHLTGRKATLIESNPFYTHRGKEWLRAVRRQQKNALLEV